MVNFGRTDLGMRNNFVIIILVLITTHTHIGVLLSSCYIDEMKIPLCRTSEKYVYCRLWGAD